MGKPAARMGDTTAHGGTITLGNPMLMIGKMPSAALGDMHVCPMCTGPVPHVGGAITLGSMGVLLGKKPGARVSDLSVCVGPPSMPAMGCFTVLIGEAGSGSQAGSAAAAAAAAALSKKGPKSVQAFPLGEPPGPVESHEILVEFTDSAGKPLSGVVYQIKDPDGKEILGASTLDGTAQHGGYDKKGSYELTVKILTDVKWAKAEAGLKDAVKFSAKADSFDDGVEAAVMILEECGGSRRLLDTLKLKVQGQKIEGEWKWKKDYLPDEAEPRVEVPSYYFQVVAGGLVGVSGPLKLKDTLSVTVVDPEGEAKRQLDYEIHGANGQLKTGKLDDSGKVTVADVAPGLYKVKLINLKGKDGAAPAEKPAPGPKPSYVGFGDVKEAERRAETEDNKDSKPADSITAISGTGLTFPLKQRPKQSYHIEARSFGWKRTGGKKKDRLHGGCDLYAPVGTEVFSVAKGTVWKVAPFYLGTWEITVDHGTFMVRYGELKENVATGIKEGAAVEKGALLGYVGKLEGLKISMLHFELYDKSATGELTDHFNPPYYRRKDLLNPTSFLDELQT